METNLITPEQLASCGTESGHQSALFAWAATSGYAELLLMFAIPNGGLRNEATANRLKAEGVKRGVPDIFLPVARQGCHGLFIELKRPKSVGKAKGRASEKQNEWIDKLREQGYGACSCEGWVAARDVIVQYLT